LTSYAPQIAIAFKSHGVKITHDTIVIVIDGGGALIGYHGQEQ